MSADNRAGVQRVLLITLGLNLTVLVIKGVLGLLTGSLSLLADTLHSVTDSANNLVGLLTNRLADPKPDQDHPYGHLKYDAIGALAIAFFLAIACFEILKGAVLRLFDEVTPLTLEGPELSLLLVVLAINLLVTLYERRAGRRLGSAILIADARHTLSDVWVTSLVLAGLCGVWLGQTAGYPWMAWLDVLLALPVALLVLRSGWQVVEENLPWLVDHYAVPAHAIHDLTMAIDGVVNCHAIASRGVVGRQLFIEMHLVVEPRDVAAAHRITEEIEQRLTETYGPVRASIHIEPRSHSSDRLSYGEANDDGA